MKTGYLIGIIVVMLIIVIGGYFLFQSKSAPETTNTGNIVSSGNNVKINNFVFSPATLTIKVGDSVTWTNNDNTQHTVTSDTGSELASSTLAKGQTYSHIFNTAGTYDYHCSIHTSMKAKIIVE